MKNFLLDFFTRSHRHRFFSLKIDKTYTFYKLYHYYHGYAIGKTQKKLISFLR